MNVSNVGNAVLNGSAKSGEAYGTSARGAPKGPDAAATIRTAAPVQTSTAAPPVQKKSSAEEIQRLTAELQRRVNTVAPELVFSIDQSSGRSVIQITDSATKEVIRQIPSEDTLQMNQALERFQHGLLLDNKA